MWSVCLGIRRYFYSAEATEEPYQILLDAPKAARANGAVGATVKLKNWNGFS